MKKRYDMIHAVILIFFLIIANLIGNAIVKGIFLLLFSGVLIFNTAMKLVIKKEDKFTEKFFFGILLFLDLLLAIGAIFVIVTAIIGVLN